MDDKIKQKLEDLLQEIAILTAACEGNAAHDSNITNKAIWRQALCVQLLVQEILGK